MQRNGRLQQLYNRIKNEIYRQRHFAAPVLIVLWILTLLYRINEPLGGFHGFNEAFYSSLAKQYLSQPLINIFVKPLDFNNPPLFTLMLIISFKIFGFSEASARLVSILASIF